MIPLILGAVGIVVAVSLLSDDKKSKKNATKAPNNEFSGMSKIPESKLPAKIRYYDDGKDISSRVYEIWLYGKWSEVTKTEFEWLQIYGGGHEDIEYRRKSKTESGKYVYYKEKVD